MGAKTHYEDASSFLLLFVCFKGGMGARDPQSREFPLNCYSGLGTWKIFLLLLTLKPWPFSLICTTGIWAGGAYNEI